MDISEAIAGKILLMPDEAFLLLCVLALTLGFVLVLWVVNLVYRYLEMYLTYLAYVKIKYYDEQDNNDISEFTFDDVERLLHQCPTKN